jgi:glycerol-3-phosphate acyltransferase PlsY
VLRALGPATGLAVFAGDVLKGVAGVTLCRALGAEGWTLGMSALFTVLGHIFSPWLGFRGGKGVASTLGVALALSPLAGALAFGLWLIIVLATRIVSAASLTAGVALALAIGLINPGRPDLLLPMVAVVIVVVGRHHENIERLLRGEEHRFGSRKSAPDGDEAAAAAAEQ